MQLRLKIALFGTTRDGTDTGKQRKTELISNIYNAILKVVHVY